MDGKDHINIYSKGKTTLGRFLSNFHRELLPTRYGQFMSIEGLWYWMGLSLWWDEPEVQTLRELSGNAAKLKGQELRARYGQTTHGDFQDAIIRASETKLVQNTDMFKLYVENELPFSHYYNFKGNYVFPNTNKFQMDWFNRVFRQQLGLEPLD